MGYKEETLTEPSENSNIAEVYIYESPDKGKTVYRRKFGSLERELVTGGWQSGPMQESAKL